MNFLNIIKDVGLTKNYPVNQTSSDRHKLEHYPPSRDTSTKREEQPSCSKIQGDDSEFQAALLAGVSRTFALTIPQLPPELRHVVSNAYLLCRTVDTIEDEPGLSPAQKKSFCDQFLEILQTDKNPERFISQLGPLLTGHTIPAEHDLIRQLNRVVGITKSFTPEQQAALVRCVKIMSEGMVYFQYHASPGGLQHQEEMDKYCYHVAGVVGEMLTDLFCYYSSEIALHHQELHQLSRSFGQGLQMTNILKDIWDDQKRGVCWLPKDLFERNGINLENIETYYKDKHYQQGMYHLLGIAHCHLENALQYTLLIPAHEKGIREFCLWALGMAMLTLRKINRNPGFTSGKQVKISRNSVKATVLLSGLTVKYDGMLKSIFRLLGKDLPKVTIPRQPAA